MTKRTAQRPRVDVSKCGRVETRICSRTGKEFRIIRMGRHHITTDSTCNQNSPVKSIASDDLLVGELVGSVSRLVLSFPDVNRIHKKVRNKCQWFKALGLIGGWSYANPGVPGQLVIVTRGKGETLKVLIGEMPKCVHFNVTQERISTSSRYHSRPTRHDKKPNPFKGMDKKLSTHKFVAAEGIYVTRKGDEVMWRNHK